MPNRKCAEWYILFSGFLQQASTQNGMERIFWDVCELVKARPARVELRRWCDNTEELAEWISRSIPEDSETRIVVMGYSWGGMAAKHFADELRKRGHTIDEMILSDPVYRHWYWCGNWRAFLSGLPIRISDNVKRVRHFAQRENYPRGHPVVANNPGKTIVEDVSWLSMNHVHMDDAWGFRQACLEAAKGEVIS